MHAATSSFSGARFSGRAALQHTFGYVDFATAQAHRFDHLIQQLAGAAYEGEALYVFIVARAFADEHQFGAGVACAEYDFVATAVQFAASAIVAEVGADAFERVAFDAGGGFE